MNDITVICIKNKFWPVISSCIICDTELQDCVKGIPMYEGIPVPVDWSGEWGGFDACDTCYDKYENNELDIWSKEDLEYSQKFNQRETAS